LSGSGSGGFASVGDPPESSVYPGVLRVLGDPVDDLGLAQQFDRSVTIHAAGEEQLVRLRV